MKQVRAGWDGAVLVCGKCSKKLGGGFGRKGKTALAKALREQPGFGKGRKAHIGVVETRCLKVCPRGAVTLVDTRRPHRWLIVPAGDDVAALSASIQNSPTGEGNG